MRVSPGDQGWLEAERRRLWLDEQEAVADRTVNLSDAVNIFALSER